jgi:hypothetical protein
MARFRALAEAVRLSGEMAAPRASDPVVALLLRVEVELVSALAGVLEAVA